jgi:hypothetical protein
MPQKSFIEVYMKLSTSACNKELLEFLHRNIGKLVDFYKFRATIIKSSKDVEFDLPALVIDGKTISGAQKIIAEIKRVYKVKITPRSDTEIVDDHWRDAINTPDPEEDDPGKDIARKVAEAMQARAKDPVDNVSKSTPVGYPQPRPRAKSKKHKGGGGDGGGGAATTDGRKPSELETDPMMKKYWEGLGQ